MSNSTYFTGKSSHFLNQFLNEMKIFRIISNCIQLLIHNIEVGCEPAFNLMIKVSLIYYDFSLNSFDFRLNGQQWKHLSVRVHT